MIQQATAGLHLMNISVKFFLEIARKINPRSLLLLKRFTLLYTVVIINSSYVERNPCYAIEN